MELSGQPVKDKRNMF